MTNDQSTNVEMSNISPKREICNNEMHKCGKLFLKFWTKILFQETSDAP